MLLLGLVAFSAIGGLVKLLSEDLSITQILLFRFGLASIPFIIMMPFNGGLQVMRVSNRMGLFIRSISGITSLSLCFYTIAAIPLVDATALAYAAPIFVVLLSIPCLGEKIGLQRWLAVFFGFIGILVISQPSGGGWSLGYLSGITSAFFGAMVAIWLRKLASTERTSTIAIYYNISGAIVFGCWTLFSGWTELSLEQWALLLILGGIASMQQYLLTSAFRFSEASLLAPFDYVAMIIAAVLGYVFWNETPTFATIVGCCVIAGSGIFVAYRESLLRK